MPADSWVAPGCATQMRRCSAPERRRLHRGRRPTAGPPSGPPVREPRTRPPGRTTGPPRRVADVHSPRSGVAVQTDLDEHPQRPAATTFLQRRRGAVARAAATLPDDTEWDRIRPSRNVFGLVTLNPANHVPGAAPAASASNRSEVGDLGARLLIAGLTERPASQAATGSRRRWREELRDRQQVMPSSGGRRPPRRGQPAAPPPSAVVSCATWSASVRHGCSIHTSEASRSGRRRGDG